MTIILILIILALVGYILWLKKPQAKPQEKPKKISKEEKQKQKDMKTAFDNLMRYDVEVAIRRK